jgi:Bacterial regulatory proteins, luxR family
LRRGYWDRGIVGRLFISPNTVDTHIQRIFTKLGLPDSGDVNRLVDAVLMWAAESQSRTVRRRRPPTAAFPRELLGVNATVDSVYWLVSLVDE